MIKCIGYIRVSTADQAEYGFSLEAQSDKIKGYCALYDMELVEIVSDALSAKDMNRPGLTKAMSMLDRGDAESLVVIKLDRLTRSVRDLANLLDKFSPSSGLSLVSVSEHLDTKSAAGRLCLNMLISVSQWEREVISERTSAVLQHKKANGKVFGNTPYGYDRIGDDLIANDAEQAICLEAQRRHFNRESIRSIMNDLNEREVPSKKGCAWSYHSVERITKK